MVQPAGEYLAGISQDLLGRTISGQGRPQTITDRAGALPDRSTAHTRHIRGVRVGIGAGVEPSWHEDAGDDLKSQSRRDLKFRL
jgi:hypothetical protein